MSEFKRLVSKNCNQNFSAKSSTFVTAVSGRMDVQTLLFPNPEETTTTIQN